jgi:hypothetical protein
MTSEPSFVLYQLLHQGQADAQSTLRAPGRGVDLREHVEDVAELVLRNADTGIADGHGDFIALALRAHGDLPARIGVFAAVADRFAQCR